MPIKPTKPSRVKLASVACIILGILTIIYLQGNMMGIAILLVGLVGLYYFK